MAKWDDRNIAMTVTGRGRLGRRLPCSPGRVQHQWLDGDWGSGRKAANCLSCGRSFAAVCESAEAKAARLAAGGWVDGKGNPLPGRQKETLARLATDPRYISRVFGTAHYKALLQKCLIDILGRPTREGRLALSAVDPVSRLSLDAVVKRCLSSQ